MATDLETASERDTASVEMLEPTAAGRSRAPELALVLVVVGSFALYTLLALAVGVPRVHPDEVRYLIAASSLVEGEGLTLRGADYGFGPVLAVVLAAILWLAGSVDAAYDWFKAANALFLALTAVPVYLLARRLVSAWWAVLAAALSVAIPSSVSVATVMTESVSYLATAWAVYAIALALERPTILRQFALLGAIAVAFLTRPQFGILYATWVGALAILWLLVPESRPRTRRDVLGYWPTLLPPVLAVLAFAARLVAGASARDSFGAYWELWRGYDPFQVGKWIVYHLGDFTVYLAVVPIAVAPIVLWELGRAGRAGSRPAAAFVALFTAANVTGSSSSPPSRARHGATTASTTATPSTSSRCGSSGSSSGSRPACRVPWSRPRSAPSRRSRFHSSFPSGSSRTRRESTPSRGRCGCGSRPSSRDPGRRPAVSP